ncbi:MAG TPA: pyridoxamine 5'-phosphate oxidase family protein [Acidimicrobiales bacterium]|nr:pyridoxamine 5'-phosphate oxidase family protein [Acidimicrobiales bacterium]
MTSWGVFAAAEPELAAFVAERLLASPAYLATVRAGGRPRVHPVTPILTADGLYVFMEPSSPNGADLRRRGWFALHSGVPDNAGTGGEASVSGTGHAVEDAAVRATVAAAARYPAADRYVLFELRPSEVRCNGYGDVALPGRRRWRSDFGSGS